MQNKRAVKITKDELLEKLTALGVNVVLTKNKYEESEENFRPDPKNPSVMIDGYWVGKPKQVNEGDYCAHFVKHKDEFWIGAYGGTIEEKTIESERQRYSLIMRNPVKYVIQDMDRSSKIADDALLKNFLQKNGSVTYTYFPNPRAQVQEPLDSRKMNFKIQSNEVFSGSEINRIMSARVNHGRLRLRTLKDFDNACALSGLNYPDLLVCSHIKPWAKSTSAEKTDRGNVLLLAANWDYCFDRGYITINDDGAVKFSPKISDQAKNILGLSGNLMLNDKYLSPERKTYLAYHRKFIFIK